MGACSLLIAEMESKPTTICDWPKVNEHVWVELNRAREDPPAYAKFLEKRKVFYTGKRILYPGHVTILTEEGLPALEEAIRFLKEQAPLPPFAFSKGMSQGAQDLVDDQSSTGKIGHLGGDKSQTWDRVNRYGKWQLTVGENICYGESIGRDIVVALIIDDGVSDRGHRSNIFNPAFHVVGVATGTHNKYRSMAVITFAGGFAEGK